MAWLPTSNPRKFVGGNADTLKPVAVYYNTLWRTDYPKLKRGETLTYQGGEYFNETPGSEGLPALVAVSGSPEIAKSKKLVMARAPRIAGITSLWR